MSWGAVIAHVGTSVLELNAAYEQSKLIDINSKLNQTFAGIEADQMMRQATSLENQGVRASQIEQYKTRSTMSDATAAMAAAVWPDRKPPTPGVSISSSPDERMERGIDSSIAM
jgi:hypothetical protein